MKVITLKHRQLNDFKAEILELCKQGSSVALGMFDGVHLGHRAILESTCSEEGLVKVVLSLANHPRKLTQGKAPKRLSSDSIRTGFLNQSGIELSIFIEFDEDFMALEASDYLETYLKDLLNAKVINVGYDHHFGKNRSGTPKLLEDWCSAKGIKLNTSEAVSFENKVVSSSVIRELITDGEISEANKLLGHAFKLRAKVIRGEQRGRTLGFPTANLEIDSNLILPAIGVYAVTASLSQNSHMQDLQNSDKYIGHSVHKRVLKEQNPTDEDLHTSWKAVCNLGYKPSFHNNQELGLNLEVHILDFDQDIYDQELELEFHKRIRAEKKFNSKEELIDQISKDIEEARCYTK